MKICLALLALLVAAAASYGCSTDPSVHVPPDAPVPRCADVPACAHTFCRADDPPGYCTCGGILCMRDGAP